jgi:hypothetical protein
LSGKVDVAGEIVISGLDVALTAISTEPLATVDTPGLVTDAVICAVPPCPELTKIKDALPAAVVAVALVDVAAASVVPIVPIPAGVTAKLTAVPSAGTVLLEALIATVIEVVAFCATDVEPADKVTLYVTGANAEPPLLLPPPPPPQPASASASGAIRRRVLLINFMFQISAAATLNMA